MIMHTDVFDKKGGFKSYDKYPTNQDLFTILFSSVPPQLKDIVPGSFII